MASELKACRYCGTATGQIKGGAKPVATVRVRHNGYCMELSTYVAYALPEGAHELYAYPTPTDPRVAALVEAAKLALETPDMVKGRDALSAALAAFRGGNG